MSEHSAENDVGVTRQVLTRYERRPEQKQTVAQMVEWCEENGLDPAEVRVSGGFNFMWKSPETDEELTRRAEHKRYAEERHLEWLRRQVLDRFGYVIPPGSGQS